MALGSGHKDFQLRGKHKVGYRDVTGGQKSLAGPKLLERLDADLCLRDRGRDRRFICGHAEEGRQETVEAYYGGYISKEVPIDDPAI